MHSVTLIASAISGSAECASLPDKKTMGFCALTGDYTLCVSRGELFGKSFTNIDLLKAPESNLISCDAYLALGYKWERMSSWFTDGKVFNRLQRADFRSLILNGTDAETWSAYITTSYKKHGALNAPVNNGRFGIIRFENVTCDCRDSGKVNSWYSEMDNALRLGFGRSVIESLNCPPFLMQKYGFEKWMKFEQWARPKFQSPLYQLLCYILPTKEELKDYEKRAMGVNG